MNNRDAVRYCFAPLIENELAIEWNHHHIRKTENTEAQRIQKLQGKFLKFCITCLTQLVLYYMDGLSTVI